jgi:putative membrane protein
MFWYGHGMGPFGAAVMIVVTLVVVASAIFAVAMIVRAVPGDPPPERILADRYARGEITDDEYRQRLATLQHR